MSNYFNQLPFRLQRQQLGQCRFMSKDEFEQGCDTLKNKSIVIIGCGAQGLNQGLNMRDSGLSVSYALRDEAIKQQRTSWQRATQNGFKVASFNQLIPKADVVYNLTPDKQHQSVVETIMPLMKQGATLAYSHGFNIVEQAQSIRSDITVIMCAPKCPGTEVREEYKRGFGVPTLIAVHPENDPYNKGLEQAKALASATGGDRAGVLESSFIAEVKSDLMGEQTILCGMLQTASILAFDFMTDSKIDSGYAAKLIQNGLEVITEALKVGGISHMMDRLNNPSKLAANQLSEQAKEILRPLFAEHMDNILSGQFSTKMIEDWHNNDKQLLSWRQQTSELAFEHAATTDEYIPEQHYFDKSIFLVAMIKAGVELSFELMVESGILPESAYYESLHEVPLIANTIARKRLHEMNVVISDTAEYGNYLFTNKALTLLQNQLMPQITEQLSTQLMGHSLDVSDYQVENQMLKMANDSIRNHPVELIGRKLRAYMKDMKAITLKQ